MMRIAFLLNFLICCWLWMQIVHEAGHVLGGWATGGTVERVVLHPLTISRTEISGSSQPLVVIWAGPIIGCVLPIAAWLVAVALQRHLAFLLRFFAGFCLVVNGAYLAAGSFDGIGDCGDLLRLGTPIWLLWLFGALTLPAGLLLWHRQAQYFGQGPQPRPLNRRTAYFISGLALGTILGELAYS